MVIGSIGTGFYTEGGCLVQPFKTLVKESYIVPFNDQPVDMPFEPSPTFIGEEVPAKQPPLFGRKFIHYVDSIPQPECVNVTMDGAVLSIPVDDLVNPAKMRWWFQVPPIGAGDAKTYACAKAAWMRYAALTGKPQSKVLARLRKSGFQFWFRCKLTQWGLI